MARLVFAAHDPGGARMLAPMAGPARRKGFGLTFLAAGPALDIWRDGGETVATLDAKSVAGLEKSFLDADLLVTGTGFSDFEKDLWDSFRGIGVPSLAAIDSWSNFKLRFVRDLGGHDGLADVQPDAIAVVDEFSRRAIEEEGWRRARLFVVGQPHLESYVPRIRGMRDSATNTASAVPGLVFFSEPIEEDYGDKRRGFNQFDVARSVVDALIEAGIEAVLEIKSHPRESAGKWRAWAGDIPTGGLEVKLSGRPVDELLIEADGVLGMTSMVLIEAHLARIPTLSLQPGRSGIINPVIDDIITVISDSAAIGGGIEEFVSGLPFKPDVHPNTEAIIRGAADRFMEAIEKMAALETNP